MTERLYTEYPELYDAIQADWDYDRDVEIHDGYGPDEDRSVFVTVA